MKVQIPEISSSDKITVADLPNLVVGAGTPVPTLSGDVNYVNFDNAASTPTFRPTIDAINQFLEWYSNVHRGTGFKSQLSSWAFEEARDIVAEFVGADLESQIVLFTKNSTEAINKLSRRLELRPADIILTTLMEHHSNELPWRRVGKVVHVALNPDGTISKEDFQQKLKDYAGKIKIVAVTGASNVTGYINDIDYFAAETHKAGAKILIDGAQLIPHRPVRMKYDDPMHKIDYLVFSAHKMYAPFGIGVLVGDREIFEAGDPSEVGGGVVDIVTLEEAYWSELPDKEEAGTPDIVGVVALGKAIRLFQQLGWESIIQHESELTAYALEKLAKVKGVTLYGDTDPKTATNRLGVIAFNVDTIPHAMTAAILSYEGGIGVRAGCFCAHTYVKELLHVTDEHANEYEQEILSRNRSHLPGAVRASFGLYNTTEEIDRLVEVITNIAAGKYNQDYQLDAERGEYHPKGFNFDFEQYFRF